LICDLYSIASI